MGKTLESRLTKLAADTTPGWNRTPYYLGGFPERKSGSSCLIQLLFTIFLQKGQSAAVTNQPILGPLKHGNVLAIEQKARMVRNKLLVIVEPHRKIVSLKRKREFRNKVDLLAREAVVGQIVHARP